mgnify:FL=1
MSENFVASILVFVFILLCAGASYADDADDLARDIQEQLKNQSIDISDWVNIASSQDISVDINPESDDSGTTSGDKKATSDDNKVVWAQEPSQIAIAILTFAEMLTINKIYDDQNKMLNKWDNSKIDTERNKILNNMKNARDILVNSPAFNHLSADISADIDAFMKSRYPEWKSNMTSAEAAKRINDRQSKWKESVRIYLKSMNATTSHFDDDLAMRNELLKILKNPDGQVQALQVIGGYLDHMNMMMARDDLVLQSLMTVLMERRLDLREERNDLGKAVLEVGTNLQNYKPKVKKCRLGF